MQILTEKQLADCLEITRASSKGLPKVIKVATYKSKQRRWCIFVDYTIGFSDFTNRHLSLTVLQRMVEFANFIQTELNRYHLLLLMDLIFRSCMK